LFEFSRDSITVMGFSVHYYGILIALGALLGVILAMKREKKLGFPKDTVIDIALICIPSAIICARLYYVIFEWELYRGNLLSIFDLRSGGLAIYGGIIGGLLSGYFVARYKKLSFLALADLAAPSMALGQAIGRWGNFFNQEAYGRAIENPALHFFPMGVFIESDGLWHYATFFYESIWCFLIVIALLTASRRGLFRKRGDCLLWYVFLYGIERAAVEGLRTDSLYLGPVRISQLVSLTVIICVAVIFACRNGAPKILRVLSPAACILTAFLVAFGIIGSVSYLSASLFALSLILTGAQYFKAT